MASAPTLFEGLLAVDLALTATGGHAEPHAEGQCRYSAEDREKRQQWLSPL
jgi:hypothetical protein